MGFPIAIVLSWFLEFRDGKAVRDQVSPADANWRRFSRTYLSVIAGLAIAAVIVFIYDQNIGLPQAPDLPTSAAADATIASARSTFNSLAANSTISKCEIMINMP